MSYFLQPGLPRAPQVPPTQHPLSVAGQKPEAVERRVVVGAVRSNDLTVVVDPGRAVQR